MSWMMYVSFVDGDLNGDLINVEDNLTPYEVIAEREGFTDSELQYLEEDEDGSEAYYNDGDMVIKCSYHE